jgi:integrase
MSPSDRTADRLKALDKALAAGKVTPEQAAAERKRLQALGPRWEARWTLPDGKTERTKTFKSKKAAADYEAEQKVLVRRGESHDPQHVKTTLAAVLDFYLAERMHTPDGRRKGSYKNARAHRDRIVRIWGDRFTLEAFDHDPESHVAFLKRRLEKEVGESSAWNNRATGRAAVAYWIKRKRLRILNPFDAFDWRVKKVVRKDRITWENHAAICQEAAKIAPWVRVFFEMGWETGWRAGEIHDWAWERLHLNPAAEDFPWVETLTEKKRFDKPVYEEKPITFRAAALLRSLGPKAEGPVWPLKRCQHDRYIHRAFLAAGLGHLRFHDYRRSFKTRAEEAGITAPMRAAYTGHSLAMDKRYLIHGLKEYEAVLRRLEAAGT